VTSNAKTPFSTVEWLSIFGIILVWGLNNAAAKLTTEAMSPMFVGGARFAIALLFLAHFLRPPLPPWRLILPAILVAGPIHFGLVYIAFGMVDNLSPIVVALQLWIPLTVLASWIFLKETMPPAAVAGMVIAFLGVAWMSLDPDAATDFWGCLLCSPGLYQSFSKSSSCLSCSAGLFSPLLGSSNCTACSSGFYSLLNANNCQNCEPGKYQNLHGYSFCKLCQSGLFETNFSSIMCSGICTPGRYSLPEAHFV
jgi:drug/metabolite transporter (DMT)-like permease